jgi:hypothetical protein
VDHPQARLARRADRNAAALHDTLGVGRRQGVVPDLKVEMAPLHVDQQKGATIGLYLALDSVR